MNNMVWLNLLLLALRSVQSAISESCVDNGTLRLVQTRSITLGNAGRVEICMGGVWGTIAADSIVTPWSEKNAQVACIQLGFTGALNAIFQNTIPFEDHADVSVPVHLMRVECTGVEQNLTQCSSLTLSSDFTHDSDAFVVCRPNTTIRYSDVHLGRLQSGDIRLFGSSRDFSGAVQIYSSTYGWQAICPDSSWTDDDAATICQDLGYPDGVAISPISTARGPGGEPVSRRLYNAACPGARSGHNRFGVCSFRVGTTNTSNCAWPQGQYASLNCVQLGGTLVRLLGGEDSRAGIVEIAYDGRWGMVCDDSFSRIDAQAVCEGLGYRRDNANVMQLSSSAFSPILDSESNLKPIWLTQVECTSSDASLSQCVQPDTNIIGYADCSGSNIAAVDCGDPPGPVSLSSGQIYGIVFGVMIMLFVIGPLVYVFGKDYWKKRHTYDCYNTLTTPSSWCSWGHNRRTWQPPRTTPVTSTATRNSGNTTALKFDLHRRSPEPESPSNDPSDPGLSKAPPPSYQAASNFPTHDPSTDLPPPYPGRSEELAYPPAPLQPTTSEQSPYPPTMSSAAAYPPPLPGVNYQGCPLPSYPTGPPPPPVSNSSTQLPYPLDDNVNTTITTSRTVSVESASDGAGVGSGGSGGDDGD